MQSKSKFFINIQLKIVIPVVFDNYSIFLSEYYSVIAVMFKVVILFPHSRWTHLGYVRKLPVTWGKAVEFNMYSGFLHQLQLASYGFTSIWQKKCKKN